MSENKIIHLEKGRVLYHKGEECDTMFVLRSGKICLYLDYGTPHQFALAVLSSPGSSLGEMGLLEHEKRNSTAVALEDSVLVEIKSDNFETFLSRYPQEGVKIITDLAHRFSAVTQELRSTQKLVAQILQEVQESQNAVKPTLRERLKKLGDFFLDIPDDVPPDLYAGIYTRNHGHMM